MPQQSPNSGTTLYAILALVAFLCGAALLVVLIWNAELISSLGLVGNLFYVILLPLGLSAALALFGVLRSFARYRGKVLGGTLELGGPVVVFALVVIGGFYLVPDQSAFAVTVYLRPEATTSAPAIPRSGSLTIDLGPDRRREQIGDRGQTIFPGIPAHFRGQTVPVQIDVPGYEAYGSDQRIRLEPSGVYLPVRVSPARIAGLVQNRRGDAVAHALVLVGRDSTRTDALGRFELTIRLDAPRDELDARIIADGFPTWTGTFRTHSTADATVCLDCN